MGLSPILTYSIGIWLFFEPSSNSMPLPENLRGSRSIWKNSSTYQFLLTRVYGKLYAVKRLGIVETEISYLVSWIFGPGSNCCLVITSVAVAVGSFERSTTNWDTLSNP